MRTNNYSIARMLFLLVLAAVMPSMAMAEDTYIVAGNYAEIFGTGWDGNNEKNKMELDATTGLYKKTYYVASAASEIQLKVVKNGSEWIGDETGNNVTFNLTDAGDFWVIYDPEAYVVRVEGPTVQFPQGLEYSTVTAVGNGVEGGVWLNGKDWDTWAFENDMEEVSDGCWMITYHKVPKGNYTVKFALDHEWTNNFGGGEFPGFGVETDAGFDAGDIYFDTPFTADITLYLDLSNYDHSTRTGAKYKIDLSLAYDAVYMTGDWNGMAWTAKDLQMTELEDDLWEVTVTDIPESGSVCATKFTVDGSWDACFGTTNGDDVDNNIESGVTADAVMPGNNFKFKISDKDKVHSIKLSLDLREFDANTKQGAKYTITIEEKTTTILRDDALAEPREAFGDVYYDRKFVEGYNTLVLPFDYEVADIRNDDRDKVYAYGGSTYNASNNTVSVDFSQEVTSTLKANTPYLLKMKKVYDASLHFTDKQVSPSTPVISDDYYSFVGTYVALPEDNKTIVSGDYVCTAAGLKAASGGNKLNAFRAYLRSEAISVAPSAKMEVKVGADTIVVGEGDTTGISLDELLNNSTSDIYNLNGQKVSQPQKGVYIINGKKVVRK
ncbi:MAG: hypothetical protein IKH22_10075 [Prevotella sp.]|nr:hypothetical protein [Prevotella sp.]